MGGIAPSSRLRPKARLQHDPGMIRDKSQDTPAKRPKGVITVAPPSFRRERALIKRGVWPVAGCDEAGRGPLAGPGGAAAVGLHPRRVPQVNPGSQRGCGGSEHLEALDRIGPSVNNRWFFAPVIAAREKHQPAEREADLFAMGAQIEVEISAGI